MPFFELYANTVPKPNTLCLTLSPGAKFVSALPKAEPAAPEDIASEAVPPNWESLWLGLEGDSIDGFDACLASSSSDEGISPTNLLTGLL